MNDTPTTAQAVRRTIKANPATTAGSVGVVLTIVGRWFGIPLQTQVDLATLYLVAVPVLRSAFYWWEHRKDVKT